MQFKPSSERSSKLRVTALSIGLTGAVVAQAMTMMTANAAPSTNATDISSALSAVIDSAVANQKPTNTVGGLWIGEDKNCYRCVAGPAMAAAVLGSRSDDAKDREVAIKTFDHLIALYHQPDGSFRNASVSTDAGLETQFFIGQFAAAYINLLPYLDAQHATAWKNVITRSADWIVASKNNVWYANGNVALSFATALLLAYDVSGDTKYKTYYDQMMTFTVNPPQNRFPGRGFVTTKTPTKADGSDGAGYFTETGKGGTGYDPEYTVIQMDILARMYVHNQDPQLLRYLNLLTNQVMPRVDTTKWTLDTSKGTRHTEAKRSVAFTSPALYVLATMGGRSDLSGLLDSQTATAAKVFRDSKNYYNPAMFAYIGSQAAVFVMADNWIRAHQAPVHYGPTSFAVVSSANVRADSTTPSKKTFAVVGNTTSISTFDFPTSGKLDLSAKITTCQGSPVVTVSIDGKPAQQIPATEQYGTYTINDAVTAGKHTVAITLREDFRILGQCDRNAFINELVLSPR